LEITDEDILHGMVALAIQVQQDAEEALGAEYVPPGLGDSDEQNL